MPRHLVAGDFPVPRSDHGRGELITRPWLDDSVSQSRARYFAPGDTNVDTAAPKIQVRNWRESATSPPDPPRPMAGVRNPRRSVLPWDEARSDGSASPCG